MNTKTFNYVKWGFVVALIGTVATVATVPEIRCSIGLLADTCTISQQEVELITQTEIGEPLADVKLQVIAKGSPENDYTDSNGYARVNIPTKGKVRVNLNKSGYPPQNFNINLAVEQETVRIIRLSKSGQPEVIATPTAPPITAPTSTNGTTPTPETEVNPTPQPGDIGRIVTNASLINEATWTIESSPVNRLLTFYFYVEATSNGDKVGSFDATLFREGKDICTISLNSKTSFTAVKGVYQGKANCNDTLVKNSPATYRAKVKAVEMTPTTILLDYVNAVQK